MIQSSQRLQIDQALNDRALLRVGYETTSVALTYTIFAIASFPEVERRVLEEVDAFWCGTLHSSLPVLPVWPGQSSNDLMEDGPGFLASSGRAWIWRDTISWTIPAHGCEL